MLSSKKVYGVLSIFLIFSLWVLTAPVGSGGPTLPDKEYPAVTFYVA